MFEEKNIPDLMNFCRISAIYSVRGFKPRERTLIVKGIDMKFHQMKNALCRQVEKGITMIEYALIAALVAAAIAGAFAYLTSGVSTKMQAISTTLTAPASSTSSQ